MQIDQMRQNLPIHGGDIQAASEQYGIAAEKWIDLSTGINPVAYPFDAIAPSAYQNLPYLIPDFMPAVTHYYGDDRGLAVPGSQPVIQLLPQVLGGQQIMVPEIGYQEHAECWAKSRTRVVRYPSLDTELARAYIQRELEADAQQHLLVINPNNPSGIAFDTQQLCDWAALLADGYYLIVDEAFVETATMGSMLGPDLPNNAVVLRSFGKFFGLAGVRLGFVFTAQDLRQRLSEGIGLWQVNGPAQAIAVQALKDRNWQSQARRCIEAEYADTLKILSPLMKALHARCLTKPGLFMSFLVDAEAGALLYRQLAQQGILTRLVKVDNEKIILRAGIASQVHSAVRERLQSIVALIESRC